MHEHKKSKKGAELISKEKREPQLDDSCCPPEDGTFSYGYEEVTIMKKKKNSKHSTEDSELDQEVTSTRDSEIQVALIASEEEIIIKKKRKKKEHSLNIEDVASEDTTKILGEEVSKKEKKRKRKHESDESVSDKESADPSESNSRIECNYESSDFKKKKVSWKENISESKEPEVFKDNEETDDPPPSNIAFLTLLSNVDAISDQEHLANNQHISSREDSDTKELRKARKKERKIELRRAEKERRKQKLGDENLEENESKTLKSISDCNIKIRRLKEKIEKLVGNSETMNVKRSRLDGEATSGPTRKRLRSITPDREIFPGHKWKDLTDLQKETFNKKREQRRLDKLNVPKVVLVNQANYSSLRLGDEERSPLTLTDIQHFLIYSVCAHFTTGNIPSWVSLKHASKISKVVFVVVDGASLSDYTQHEDQLPALKSFNFQLEVITPYAYGGDFANEFWTVPLSKNQRAKLIRKYGSLEKANLEGEAFDSLKKMYPKGAFRAQQPKIDGSRKMKESEDPKEGELKTHTTIDESLNEFKGICDQFPRTELLLRSWDLLREAVPVPFASGYLAKKYEGFVRTKDEYYEVTDESPIWAVDCEMCETCRGSELTRISIINEDFEVVYESLVKPYNPITNYLTQYSGITPVDLQNEWTRLEDVQEDLRNLLPSDVILAGHSVGNDLLAMKMFHPYVIDTSVCFNLSGIRGRKTKLKTLMAELLYERIQEGGKIGHDSVEDAASCLKLIKAKLARSIEWGDAVLGGKRSEQESVIAQQHLIRNREEKKLTIYPVAAKSIIRSGPRAHQTVKQQSNSGKQPNPVHLKIQTTLEPQVQQTSDKAYNQQICTKSLVSHLFAAGENNVLVVGRGEFLKTGKELLDKKSKRFLQDDPRLVFTVQDDDKVLTHGCEMAPSNGVSILRLDSSRLHEKSPLETVDAMVGEAVKQFNETVLFMVLLTGKRSADESSALDNHGLFMMKILKPAYVPLTLDDLSESNS